MKFKKSVSALAALTLSVTAFAGLAVTANAAAGDVTTIYSEDFDSISEYKADSTMSGTVFTLATEGTSLTTKALKFGSSASASTKGIGFTKALKDNTDADNALSTYNNVTVDFDLEALQIRADKDASILLGFGDSENNSVLSLTIGTGKNLGTNTVTDAAGTSTAVKGSTLHFTVATDFVDKTQTIKVTDLEGAEIANIAAEAITAKNFNGFYVPNSTWKYGYALLDNLVITTTEKDVETASYRINYKLGDEIVDYDDNVAAVGSVITADTVVYTKDGRKCFITADEAPTLTVTADGENVLDVPVRLANTYTAKVVAKVNGAEKEISSTDVTEGETWSYTFPMYYQDGTTVYEIANNSGNTYYGGSVANVTENKTEPLDYTKAVYENVVLYDELDGSANNNAGVRASNCSAYDNQAYTSANLEPGTYDIYVRYLNKGRGSTMTIGEQTVLSTADINAGNWTTTKKENITVTEAAPLVWNAGGSNSYDPIDTVLVVKKADIAPKAEVETVGDLQTTGTGYSAQAYKATFTLNGYTAEKLTWSVNPAEGVEAEAQKIEQDLSGLSGESEYVVGLVVNAADFSKVKGVTATIE